jgi:hypothetical protein
MFYSAYKAHGWAITHSLRPGRTTWQLPQCQANADIPASSTVHLIDINDHW